MVKVKIDLQHVEAILREGIVIIPLNADGRYIVRLLNYGDEAELIVTSEEREIGPEAK